MVLRENDQSEQVYPIAVSATKASTNSVEPVKDTTEPGLEIVESQISKQTESAKAHLATLMTDAEEKTKKAVDLGRNAAKLAQVIAFDAEAAATEAEREYRKIIDSAVQNEEKQLKYIEKNEEIQNKIVSFTTLVITVNDAYEEAKRAAISTEAAKEAWKQAEKKAYLFKTETDTVVAAAEGANTAAKKASEAFEKVKTAIKNAETKSHKLSLSSLLQRAMEKFKSTVKESEKEMEQFEAAANLAKDAAADVAKAWLALSDISHAQTQAAKQELEKKEHKAVAMEDIEETIQAGQFDVQQRNNKTEWKTTYMLLYSLIIASSSIGIAFVGYTNFARMQALGVLLGIGFQMVRAVRIGGQIEQGEQEVPIEAAGPEVVIELANNRAAQMVDIANEQANIALNAAEGAVQARNEAVVARDNAAAARENAQARLAEAREGLHGLEEPMAELVQAIDEPPGFDL